MTVLERLESEVLSKDIFGFVKVQKPENMAIVKRKIVPVAGDLVMNGLGMDKEVRAEITRECDIIINCAASINFDDPLLDAIQINFFGCMRMLELAKECQKLEVFTHVSTAYTNCEKFGLIEEKIYDMPDGKDSDDVINSIIKMGPEEVTLKQKEIIGDFPNTYTFTKSMAERSLRKHSGNLRVAIMRPSIIISCYEEPC